MFFFRNQKLLFFSQITGEHTETMMLTSLTCYIERPNMLTHIMAHLFRLYNNFTIQKPFDAGQVCLFICRNRIE